MTWTIVNVGLISDLWWKFCLNTERAYKRPPSSIVMAFILNSRVRVTVVKHRAPQIKAILKAIPVYLRGINNLKYNK